MGAATSWAALRRHPVHLLGLIAALAYAVLMLFARTPAGPSLSVFFSAVGVAALAMLAAWQWGRSSGLSLWSVLGWGWSSAR
ncbi:MAG: hypothetical protein ACREI9_10710 [Nitrospiraceae bacterium]